MTAARCLLALCLVSLVACGSAARWTEEGDTKLRDRDLIGAEVAYNKAIAADPHHGPALYGKGWALYLSGHDELRDPCRQLFQRAIDYSPEFFGGYRGLGVLLMDEGNTAGADRMLRTAFEKDPRQPGTLTSLGQLYLAAGRLSEAQELFEEAIRVAPERGEMLRFMAEVELARGNFDSALEWIDMGRSRSVSGRAGLMALDEGELRIHLERARTLLDGSTGAADPVLVEALQALDAADRLLEEAIQDDPRLRQIGSRRRFHAALRARIEEATRP